jgi:predicted nucleic acid-binding protein
VSAVVSDTSPLHYLIECQSIEILPALFQQVLIPPTVHRELQHPKTPPIVRAWAQNLPGWVSLKSPTVVDHTLNVDEGEKEAICLAREVNAAALLIDDRKGRSEAIRCGLRVTGTIGVLEAAAQRGLLDLPVVIQRLRLTSARLDEKVIQAVLARIRPRPS